MKCALYREMADAINSLQARQSYRKTFGDLPPACLPFLIDWKPETAQIFWKPRDPDLFLGCHDPAEGCARAWNSKYAGKETFHRIGGHGYRVGRVINDDYLAHRVIWALAYGEWPSEQVDHIDGVRTNNKISNLRAVSNAENSRNVAIRGNNSSGVMGVYWHSKIKRWCAEIRADGKKQHLGTFTELADAAEARKAAVAKFGFHPNHGRTA